VISPQSGDPSTNIHANAQTCPNCRALIVSRVLDDHVAVPKVAQEFRVTSQTVHKWLRRFKSEGAKGLNDRSSAPASIPRRQIQPGKALQDAVMEVLHAPPAEFGFNRTTWRMRDLRQVLVLRGCLQR
jgi:transposase